MNGRVINNIIISYNKVNLIKSKVLISKAAYYNLRVIIASIIALDL